MVIMSISIDENVKKEIDDFCQKYSIQRSQVMKIGSKLFMKNFEEAFKKENLINGFRKA